MAAGRGLSKADERALSWEMLTGPNRHILSEIEQDRTGVPLPPEMPDPPRFDPRSVESPTPDDEQNRPEIE